MSHALIPTMGALHQGHLSLIREAQKYTSTITVSIFVNPTQFGPNEDYSRYPRSLEKDIALLQPFSVNVITPTVEDLYPNGTQNFTQVHVPELGKLWCGASRPGHFDGVTSVVTRLFNRVKPTHAFFGEKDYQQLAIIKKMTQDLCFDIQIIGCPIIREPDGLALSSRNRYFSPTDRQIAPGLHQTLTHIQTHFKNGETKVETLLNSAKIFLQQWPFELDYLGIADPITLQPKTIAMRHDRILIAAKLGQTRLIDTLSLEK
jgi:pantoate--beta-alanine ligase